MRESRVGFNNILNWFLKPSINQAVKDKCLAWFLTLIVITILFEIFMVFVSLGTTDNSLTFHLNIISIISIISILVIVIVTRNNRIKILDMLLRQSTDRCNSLERSYDDLRNSINRHPRDDIYNNINTLTITSIIQYDIHKRINLWYMYIRRINQEYLDSRTSPNEDMQISTIKLSRQVAVLLHKDEVQLGYYTLITSPAIFNEELNFRIHPLKRVLRKNIFSTSTRNSKIQKGNSGWNRQQRNKKIHKKQIKVSRKTDRTLIDQLQVIH